MRDVRHKFPLVFAGLVQLAGHVVQRGSEIPHLIVRFNINFVGQVAGGILLCTVDDLFQRPVHDEGEKDQNHKRESEHEQEQKINPCQQTFPLLIDVLQRKVDGDIAIDPEIGGDGNHDAQHLVFEIAEKRSRAVILAAERNRIKTVDDLRVFLIECSCRVQQNFPVCADEPDLGIVIGSQCTERIVKIRQGTLTVVIKVALFGSDLRGLPVQTGARAGDQTVLHHAGADR